MKQIFIIICILLHMPMLSHGMEAMPDAGSMPCARLVYSLPGAEFMHKLVTHPGDEVSDIDFGGITTLRLMRDRLDVGNRYIYVRGYAPREEGEYTYTVTLRRSNGQDESVSVRLVVSGFLQSPTPMMGWQTWNWFSRALSHEKTVDVARGMKATGLIDAGFTTIVLDDTWAVPTSCKDSLTYDPRKFPEGITGLKSELLGIDSRLRLGIYSDAGTMTCEGYQPGSYKHESQHLALFDSWGIDLLKYDYCNSEASTWDSYLPMGRAIDSLNARRRILSKQPLAFNICEWGRTRPWLWGAEAGGSSWRTTYDAREDWVGDSIRIGVLSGVDLTRRLWMYAGVNRFNDLDMMCIGLHGLGGPSNNTPNHPRNGGHVPSLTDAQARTQMSLWSMLASPLVLTCDLRSEPHAEANRHATLPEPLITSADLATLTNRDIILINQDALGQQAEYMERISTGKDYSTEGYDVYVKDLSNNRFAVSVTNRSSSSMASLTLPLQQLYMSAKATYVCRDVWAGSEKSIRRKLRTGAMKPHETKVFILQPAKNRQNRQ